MAVRHQGEDGRPMAIGLMSMIVYPMDAIYDAISVLIDIASYIAKIDDDTSPGGCRNGDLRDWPHKEGYRLHGRVQKRP